MLSAGTCGEALMASRIYDLKKEKVIKRKGRNSPFLPIIIFKVNAKVMYVLLIHTQYKTVKL